MRKLLTATLIVLAGFFLYAILKAESTPSNTCEHALTTPQTVMSSGWSRNLRQSLAVGEAAAGMTGSPVYYQGILYVPLSSFEVAHAVSPLYNCGTFRGGVHAVDAGTGADSFCAGRPIA